jgi:hypothetical protein
VYTLCLSVKFTWEMVGYLLSLPMSTSCCGPQPFLPDFHPVVIFLCTRFAKLSGLTICELVWTRELSPTQSQVASESWVASRSIVAWKFKFKAPISWVLVNLASTLKRVVGTFAFSRVMSRVPMMGGRPVLPIMVINKRTTYFHSQPQGAGFDRDLPFLHIEKKKTFKKHFLKKNNNNLKSKNLCVFLLYVCTFQRFS